MRLSIRREQERDFRLVEELTRAAFFNLYVPGCNEHYLIHLLRGLDCFLPELSLVAHAEGRIVGHIAYTKAVLRKDGGNEFPVLCLGPVSVLPALQNRGIGSALISHSKELARGMGHKAVLLYGDPLYYVRHGFFRAECFGIGTAEGMFTDPLQALELEPGALGDARQSRFHEDSAFGVDDASAAAFDADFPALIKGPSPSQARFRELVGSGCPMAADAPRD